MAPHYSHSLLVIKLEMTVVAMAPPSAPAQCPVWSNLAQSYQSCCLISGSHYKLGFLI